MTVLDIFGLLILVMLPGVAVFALYFLGGWPGKIARARSHPQAEAINICGWLGLLTGVSWVVAMVWAHWRPGAGSAPGSAELIRRIERIESRLEATDTAVEGGVKA